MRFVRDTRHLLAAAPIVIVMAGCASPKPLPYSGIASSSAMTPNTRTDDARTPYAYVTPVDWQKYKSMVVEPVAIYRGPDQQFGEMSNEDKAELARYMHSEFSTKLRTRFTLTGNSGAPDALRLKLTLTGAGTTSTVLGPFLHFDIAGNLYNGVQAVRGREGALTGYVMYSVEIFDAQSNKLLKSYVTKQYPNAMNIVAAFGSLTAAKTGIDKGADSLVADLR
ncbi:DUF3313 domain-containing protein [Cupriavidus pauculus]|uniref:DUF3313 domain-containing protein n=1 Tax=Cupriavidus pauculus TaxID=82633 RepID=A0A2N5C3D8_9BURK|nr:DUF3313 domain-containing protein [Cupriavidus pauculus]PLP96718.1 DUF3313 domain-containing protein [Cupriavidus pauculus]